MIQKVESKYLVNNVLAALHPQFSFAVPVIIAEIKPAYDKSITAGLFPDEVFGEVVCEWVESERDSK